MEEREPRDNPLQFERSALRLTFTGDDAPDVVAVALARELHEAAGVLLATVADHAGLLHPAELHLRRRQVARRARRVRTALALFERMLDH